MTARTHDAIAFASLLTLAAYNPPESLNLATAGAAIVVNIVGGTLPDIDQASNRLWDLLPYGDQVGKILRHLFMGHRTITHSILGVFLVTNISWFLIQNTLNSNFVNPDLIFFSFMIGYISHLAGDSLTKDGLPLLFPIKIKIGFPPIKAFRITAGSWIENFVILPGVAGYIFWFIGKNQEGVLALLRLIIR